MPATPTKTVRSHPPANTSHRASPDPEIVLPNPKHRPDTQKSASHRASHRMTGQPGRLRQRTAAGPAANDERDAELPATPARHSKPATASGQHQLPPAADQARPMQKGRFILGLLLSTVGLGGMLLVVFSAFRGGRFAGDWSLAAIALSMIGGLMLLGGGFGIMATASPTFDDREFEKLVELGERGVPVQHPTLPAETVETDSWDLNLPPAG